MDVARGPAAGRRVRHGWAAVAFALLLPAASACGQDGVEPTGVRIPLRVERAEGVPGPRGLPVSVGVPFPEGARAEPDGLVLRTTDGRTVPAQLEVRARHPGSGHVRWLGVDFRLDPDVDGYELVEAAAPSTGGDTVRIRGDDEVLVVDTGPLRVEIPRRGGLLRRAWLDGERVLDQGFTNELVRASDGVRFTDGSAASGAAVVETDGPYHAVVRVEGGYTSTAGEAVCRWMARLHFHAGLPIVRIAHTFVWIGSAETLQIRELALRFGLAAPVRRAWADRSARPADGAHGVALEPGHALSILQDRLWHWGHGESQFAVRAGAEAAPRLLGDGDRAGSWLAASTGRVGVSVALRDLWQLYPKELRATQEGVQVLLWSSRGDASPLDLRPTALERWWGPKMTAQLEAKRWRARLRQLREKPERHDPTGLARTHDVLLRFFRAPDGDEPPAELASWADAFDREPRVVADPAWTAASGVLGLLGERDAERPELEDAIGRVWRDVAALIDDWGDHGFLGHGGGPHFEYTLQDGRAVPTPWRFGAATGYGYAPAAWWAFLRSGDRRIFELARAHSRFLNDLVIAHEPSASRRRGDWLWTPDGTLVPWEGTHRSRNQDDPRPIWLGHRRGFGFFIEHALLAHAVTGDRWALDVAREYKDALLAWIDDQPDWPERFVDGLVRNHSRWAFQRLDELTALYLHLGDPELLENARVLADALVDVAHPSGVHREPETRGQAAGDAPSYLFYKGPGLANALRAFRGERRARVRESLVRMARHAVRTRSPEARSVGLRMAHGLAAGGDPGMLAFASKRAAEHRAVVTTEPTGRRGYQTRLSAVPAVAYNTMTNEGHLVRALAEHGPPPAPFPVVWKSRGRPAADLVLEKRPGAPLAAEISAQGGRFLGPDGAPWPDRWLGAATSYAVRRQAGRWLHREIRIPGEAPAGPYRVRLDAASGGQVLATDATGVGLVAAGGLDLGASADLPWYFEVPEGDGTLRVWASDPARVALRDAAGRAVPLPPMQDAPARIDRAGTAAGRWSARARAAVDLAVFGVPPVFAYGDPERLPDVEAEPAPAPGARAAARPAGTEGPAARGVHLADQQALVIRAADGGVLPVTHREGTVEFFLRPDWESGRLAHDTFRGLLGVTGEEGGRLELFYGHGVTSRDDEPFWDVRVHLAPARGPSRKFWLLRNVEALQWSSRRWVHVAFVWRPREEGEGRDWAFLVDGAHNPKRQALAQPLDAVLPGRLRTLEIGGPSRRLADSLRGAVQQVRISAVARYGPGGESPPAAADGLTVDERTLALFPLDEGLRAEGPAAASFRAAVQAVSR